jgi:lipid-A-disaccharide synthase
MKAALLVGFSEFNARLGTALRRRGLRVLWYAPPQVWAWRPARAHALVHSSDRLALLFPFETELWQQAGAEAHYVGHPALERETLDRSMLRRELGIGEGHRALALMPGSRAHEVRRMLPAYLQAARRLSSEIRELETRLLLSSASLPASVSRWARRSAQRAGVGVEEGSHALAAFDVAIATSGTATLECALSEVVPCIAYRTDAIAAQVARHLLTVRHVGLPNIVLDKDAFPELLQKAATPENLSRSTRTLFAELESYRASCREVRGVLAKAGTPSKHVADLLKPWLN